MSCGKPHDVPCSEVLARVYSYLDGEIEDKSFAQIRQHLDECGPCLREFGLEEAVKRLVQKCCGSESAPTGLRTKVLVRIQAIRAELEVSEFRAD
jgi:mycothiol system anti-sigma-R factor